MKGLQPRLSEVVKTERKEKNMTFSEFAEMCEVSERTMKSAEYGDDISEKSAKKILDIIGYKMVITVEIEKLKR